MFLRVWHKLLIPTLVRQRQLDLCEFSASLASIASYRTARVRPCLKRKEKKRKEKFSYNRFDPVFPPPFSLRSSPSPSLPNTMLFSLLKKKTNHKNHETLPPKKTEIKNKQKYNKNAQIKQYETKSLQKISLSSFCVGQLLLGMGPALRCG